MNILRGRLFVRRLHCPETVLSRDLFLENSRLHSLRKVSYEGPKPSLYLRSATDFASAINPRTHYDSLLEEISLDPQVRSFLDQPTKKFQDFLGPQLPLAFPDLLCIVCGLGDMPVETAAGQPLQKVQAHQEVLRGLGKRFYQLQANLATVFAGPRHLSTLHVELEHNISIFAAHDSLVLEFMKLNLLYRYVLPYRGVHSAGQVPLKDITKLRRKLRGETAVGSFYTMIGLLLTRFDRSHVQNLVQEKVLEGNFGIIKIATDRYVGGGGQQ